ncbi:hypothetical protein [Variovorax sp.]|uniref:hypothetical protein n=1 Tax=Variovorax sp. TaxID=1871043 RepID=UPI002D568D36|nr:hypothetical protein [Variovorax sp.]HYP84392.1 hypothetical protein [Variovorax sp.]
MRDATDTRTLPLPGVVLNTVDTGRLGDLFIPAFHLETAAVDELERAYKRAYGVWADGGDGPAAARRRARFDALNRAHTVVAAERDRTVQVIRDRGGLLHCF